MADREASPPVHGRWQFGLAQMLAAVTGIAVVFGVFRWADWSFSAAAVCLVLVAPATLLPSRARRSLLVILLCTYLPYAWLLGGYPWHDYRWSWIGMWPILPGLVPGAYFFHAGPYAYLEFPSMALASVLFVALGTAVAARGRWWLAGTAIAVLAVSLLNAWLAYAAYRA